MTPPSMKLYLPLQLMALDIDWDPLAAIADDDPGIDLNPQALYFS